VNRASRRRIVELAEVRVMREDRTTLSLDRLDVREGEILVVIGPNGGGKSTLLRVMGLLETPAAGSVRFLDRPVSAGDLGARRQMATVFQEPLLVDATVFDNAALGLRFRRRPADEVTVAVGRWLDRLGIGHLAHRRARTLSGGEAQRVALARALVLRPALLMLDEPFSALDQPTREALITELGRILREDRVTTVLVTHDRGEALSLGDRVAAMIGGKIRQVDEAARVFRAPVSEAVARFVGVETIVDCVVAGIDGDVVVLEVAGQRVEVAGEAKPGDAVRLCIRPEDVTLMTAPLAATSRRNHLAGRIRESTPAGAHVRTVVDCGFPLVALLTRRSADDLGLADGVPVVAAFKATAAHIIPRD
jgi:tungstate transport system ATP-binding protein